MTKHLCPICGDPNIYPLWIGKEPPDRCPEGELFDPRRCPLQANLARREAIWRRYAPDCFDAAGKILPGRIADVIHAVEAAGFDSMSCLPRITAAEWNAYAKRRGLWTDEDRERLRTLPPLEHDNPHELDGDFEDDE